MTTITTRATKGRPLSWNEMDANFNNLNNNKQELLPSQTGQNGKVLGTNGTNLSWVVGGSGGGGSGGVIAAADIFNGGASFYNLSVTPLSINNIIVVVDGIVLTPGMDYSLSGSIVTPISIWTTGTNNVNIWTIAASTNAVSTWGSITGTLSNQTDLNTALGLKANTSSLATVATSGSYNDLSSKPTIPAQFNPIAGTNVTLSGTYPNITFNASGSGGSMTYPSGTGIAVVTSGTSWGTTLTAPTGAIVGTTDSQALTNKTYNGNTWTAGTGTLTIAAGKTLTNNNTITLVGTDTSTYTFPTENASIGYINIPQNSQGTSYTTVLSDQGKHILHPSADTSARTYNIPSNATTAYPIGTAITFINQNGAGVVTISISVDTLRLAGTGSTGSRTLAANGIATAIKITPTEWIISGTGLT